MQQTTAKRIIEAFHGADPFEGFIKDEYPLDLQGWASNSPAFRELIDELRPEVIVEVGTWKGASAIFMCELMKERGLAGTVICIDTWLGAYQMRQHYDVPVYGDIRKFLNFGYPIRLYYQFLANVLHANMQDRIVPLPMTSGGGAKWLIEAEIEADLVYIDASHDARDVYFDITDYWELVRSGGAVFGDDWGTAWPGVTEAVTRFATERRLDIAHRGEGKWILRKP